MRLYTPHSSQIRSVRSNVPPAVSSSDTRGDRHYFSARAHRHAGRCKSRFRDGIDHGTSLVQRRCAWEEPGQGPGGPSGGGDMISLPPLLRSGRTLTLAALKIRKCDLDSRTRKELARATVKVAMAQVHARARERAPRPFRSAHDGGEEKSSYYAP